MNPVTPSNLSPYEILLAHEIGSVRRGELLAHHCSWHIGGPADILVEPGNTRHVSEVMQIARQQGLPVLVIGQGTNLLFDDAGFRGIVLKIGPRMAKISIDANSIVAEGGVWVPKMARMAAKSGLTGLEHIIGIPGTIGGLVLMNGGSHRRGIGDNIRRIWIVDRSGEESVLTREECQFSYRHSALMGTGAVIVKVELQCAFGDRQHIRREMVNDLRERRRKFPRRQPNCGSVFLSSEEMHASVGPPGKIIEEAGLKGARIGQAEVSARHANFIINRGGASSGDVLALIRRIRQVVQDKIGFDLLCEVRYVSPDGRLMPADQAFCNLK